MSDISIAVREGTDAVMLSGESAYGAFPYKAVDVMATVAKHTEQSMLSYAVSCSELHSSPARLNAFSALTEYVVIRSSALCIADCGLAVGCKQTVRQAVFT